MSPQYSALMALIWKCSNVRSRGQSGMYHSKSVAPFSAFLILENIVHDLVMKCSYHARPNGHRGPLADIQG